MGARTILGMLAALAVGVAVTILLPTTWSQVTFALEVLLKGAASPGDGREQRLLSHVLSHSPAGDPKAALLAADKYSWEKEWFMAVGDIKGKIVQQAIANMTTQPRVLLELGTYCGYGSVTIASSVTQPGFKLYTVEIVERNAKVARQLFKHTGLDDSIEVLLGPLSEHIEPLKQRGVESLDFVFIDHDKDAYLPDLKRLMEAGMLHPGTVVVADNLMFPGSPKYVEFMKTSQDFSTEWHTTQLEYQSYGKADIVAVSVYNPAQAQA